MPARSAHHRTCSLPINKFVTSMFHHVSPDPHPHVNSLMKLSLPQISIGSFVSLQVEEVLRSALGDRRAKRAALTCHETGAEAAIATLRTAQYDLIIIEIKREPQDLLSVVNEIAQACEPGTRALIVGPVNDIQLYRELKKRGVSEYLSPPFTAAELLETIAGIFEEQAASRGRTTAFVGTRGGVGSSAIAHNIAVCASETTDTILLDLDFAFGTSSFTFDVPPKYRFDEAITSACDVDELMVDRLLTRINERLSFLSLSAPLDIVETCSNDVVVSLVETACRMAPNVIIDLPNTYSPLALDVLAHVDEVVLISNTTLVDLRNANLICEHLSAARPPDTHAKVLLNRVGGSARGTVDAKEFNNLLSRPVFASVPHEPDTFAKAHEAGRPLFLHAPRSRSAKIIRTITDQLFAFRTPQPSPAFAAFRSLIRIG